MSPTDDKRHRQPGCQSVFGELGPEFGPELPNSEPGRYLRGYPIFAECPAVAPGAAVFAFAVGVLSMDVPGGSPPRFGGAISWWPAPPP